MVTPAKPLLASGHRAKARGVLLAGGILFVIGFGGSGLVVADGRGPQSVFSTKGTQA